MDIQNLKVDMRFPSTELDRLIRRVDAGDTITISGTETRAWVNKYGDNPEEVYYDWARSLVFLRVVEHESGNFETLENHYKKRTYDKGRR